MGIRGQMKIQQMAFMIMAVFFFFVLVGLFFLGIQFRGIGDRAQQLNKDQALTSLEIIADMPEFSYGATQSMTLDEDKLRVMLGNHSDLYRDFWPVASIRVYKAYPRPDTLIECPATNCNYYDIYDNGQRNIQTYSTYVSICKNVRESGHNYDRCVAGKLDVGVVNVEED